MEEKGKYDWIETGYNYFVWTDPIGISKTGTITNVEIPLEQPLLGDSPLLDLKLPQWWLRLRTACGCKRKIKLAEGEEPPPIYTIAIQRTPKWLDAMDEEADVSEAVCIKRNFQLTKREYPFAYYREVIE